MHHPPPQHTHTMTLWYNYYYACLCRWGHIIDWGSQEAGSEFGIWGVYLGCSWDQHPRKWREGSRNEQREKLSCDQGNSPRRPCTEWEWCFSLSEVTLRWPGLYRTVSVNHRMWALWKGTWQGARQLKPLPIALPAAETGLFPWVGIWAMHLYFCHRTEGRWSKVKQQLKAI